MNLTVLLWIGGLLFVALILFFVVMETITAIKDPNDGL
jgi:hypothetical protein